jgi:hypothetical protein
MKLLEEMLGLRLIESLTESPDWESTWWDAVYRGLQEESSAKGSPDCEFPGEAAPPAAASTHLVN